jgi:hypothetical protein
MLVQYLCNFVCFSLFWKRPILWQTLGKFFFSASRFFPIRREVYNRLSVSTVKEYKRDLSPDKRRGRKILMLDKTSGRSVVFLYSFNEHRRFLSTLDSCQEEPLSFCLGLYTKSEPVSSKYGCHTTLWIFPVMNVPWRMPGKQTTCSWQLSGR